MKTAKKVFKWVLYFLLIPTFYLIISLIATLITVERKIEHASSEQTIYLSTNGVHLDIVLPKDIIASPLLDDLRQNPNDNYLAFGWGDENFYINTPTWSDLTFNTAFSAMFLKSTTLMHVTRYKQKRVDWVEIKINETELQKLMLFITSTFETNADAQKILLANTGYSLQDDFYKAKGSYSCLYTCNSWANCAFKESGLKCCLWTLFDFGLLNKYD